MDNDNFITNFVDALEFDVLLAWCDIMNVPHNAEGWTDDNYPDETDALRSALIEKFQPKATFIREIGEGEQRRREADYVKLHRQLQDEAKHLKADCLTELIFTAKVLRHRQGCGEWPRIDELAEMAPEAPDRQREGVCGRCYDEGVTVFPPNCAEKPEALTGQPIGQYHCPDCGAMVMAGLPHPDLCQKCLDRNHPGIDKPKPETFQGLCETDKTTPIPLDRSKP